MKKTIKTITLVALALALLMAQVVWAEPSDAVKGVYEALVAEGSDYSEMKAMYMEYFDEIEFTEELADDGFTLAIAGSGYMDGSWTFTESEGYLTVDVSSEDFGGAMMVTYVVFATGDYYGFNNGALSGYINGLTGTGIENDNFIAAINEETEDVTFSINISGPWDMAELDQMILTEDNLMSAPLDDEYVSMSASIGKVRMIINGTASEATLLLSEYGELDDIAYQSIINVVGALQPTGYEAFLAEYTELIDAAGEGYTVTLNVDDETVLDIIDTETEGYSFAVLHFGE